MAKAGARAVKVEITTVGLQTVAPAIPRDPVEKDLLKEDLKHMGYEGLIAQPWTLKNRDMVQEFLRPRSNEWERMIRCVPEK